MPGDGNSPDHLGVLMPLARRPDQSAPTTVSPTGVGYEGPKEGRDPRAQAGDKLTTPNGVRIDDSDHSLKAGPRGPVLLEDFHLREKIMHFDHERIPERVVHARGAGPTASSPPTGPRRR